MTYTINSENVIWDNVDLNTTQFVLPDGTVFEITREDCKEILDNMEENNPEG